MLNPVYCRQLEDGSGFGVFQGILHWSKRLFREVLDERWESCLGLGQSRVEAWKDYRTRTMKDSSI
jgi:hypothetical protein